MKFLNYLTLYLILHNDTAKKQIEINHRAYRKKLRSIETIGLIRFLGLLYTIMFFLSSMCYISARESNTYSHNTCVHIHLS